MLKPELRVLLRMDMMSCIMKELVGILGSTSRGMDFYVK